MARTPNTPNKNKQFLLKRLQDMYGDEFHPIMNMADMAMKLHKVAQTTEEVGDMKACIDAWDKIAQYTEPKLKATEVTGEGGGEIAIKLVSYSD